MVDKFFDKESSVGLPKELQKPINRKFERRKVCSSFIDNIWSVDLPGMQLISTFNKGIRFLLNVYIDKLDDIDNKYNNTYHNTIKMKPVDVKSIIYIDFGIENNDKDSKFKVGNHARISKYINIFAKGLRSKLE